MKIKLGKYRHYKGFVVEVIGTALHSETLEEMIIYKHKTMIDGYGETELWARPIKMWFDEVKWEGKKMKRFVFFKNDF